MRRILKTLLFFAALFFAPKAALAVSCSPSHTFVTGETLTAAILNSNPTTFSGCFNTIDNTNIGSAGLYASQLKPTSLSNAQFGGNQTYTFGAPSLSTVPLRIGGVSGQTADLLDIEPLVGSTIVDWFDSTGKAFLGNTVVVTGEIWQTDNGFTYHQFIDSGGHIGWYNANTSTTLPTQITMSDGSFQAQNITALGNASVSGNASVTGNTSLTGTLAVSSSTTTSGVSNTANNVTNAGRYEGKYGTSTSYVVPFDANSTSGANATHIEHGSVTTSAFSAGFACASSHNFNVAYDATPDITLTMIGDAVSGSFVKPYISSRSASAFTACAEAPSSASGTVTFSWISVGE